MSAPAAALSFLSSPEVAHGGGTVDVDGKPTLCWIGNARGDALPVVDMLSEKTDPAFEGTPDDFVAAHSDVPGIAEQMRNKVRKCAQCGKPNAFTLSVCNACGDDLTKVEVGFTPNIFMGFVYGIQKGPFPYTISMRAQDENTIVFDDLLSLSTAHLNCVPTDVFIPDFRYLLLKPAEGLAVLNRMFEACFAVLKTQFLANAEYCKTMRDVEKLSDDDLRALVVSGMNYPPSQYQLHLQFMLPPFLPFQWRQCLAGVHFTAGRFFSLRYLQEVLKLLIASGETYSFEPSTPVPETTAFFAAKGVDYDTIHKEETDKFYDAHRRLSNWNAEKFESVVVGEQVFDVKDATATASDKPSNTVVNDDKTALQNYGRPYADSGRPSGTYYKFAKKPSDVAGWN
jgi:hypothetical protein